MREAPTRGDAPMHPREDIFPTLRSSFPYRMGRLNDNIVNIANTCWERSPRARLSPDAPRIVPQKPHWPLPQGPQHPVIVNSTYRHASLPIISLAPKPL